MPFIKIAAPSLELTDAPFSNLMPLLIPSPIPPSPVRVSTPVAVVILLPSTKMPDVSSIPDPPVPSSVMLLESEEKMLVPS